jgi:glyoxylase-like metal-dependent hydrolase (beta-lactamase superfamily II)
MSGWHRLLVVVAVSNLTLLQAVAPRPAPRKIEVSSGVFVYMTAPYGAVGLDGNSIVVLARDGVLVFDTNGTPSAAAAVLADVRTMTNQPVRYVVHSHWHWDHWYGAEVYTRAFPEAKVIAHEKTRALMAGPAVAFNQPGLDTQLPGYISALAKRVSERASQSPPPANLPAMRDALDTAREFLREKSNVTHVLPTDTFANRMDLALGDRQIQILNFGRGVTPGDAVMYLPKERVLVTGDLIVNPITFALSGFPSEWLKVLEALDALPADVIITGHGEPLRDKSLLTTTMEVFRRLIAHGQAAHARGMDPDEAKDAIMPELEPLMTKLTGNVFAQNTAFETQLVDWFLHRVYDELTGPLSDAIAPIPPK